MSDGEDSVAGLRKALAHLHDPLYLGALPLADTMGLPPGTSVLSRGLKLRRALWLAIRAFTSGSDTIAIEVDPRAREVLYRYAVSKQGMVAIASELHISERHAYRELRRAIGALAQVMSSLGEGPAERFPPSHDKESSPVNAQGELERLLQVGDQNVDLTSLPEDSVASILSLAAERGVDIQVAAEPLSLYVTMNLRIPGPTPLPPEVMRAVGQQMISHRGPQFEAMFRDVSEWLKVFFETESEVYLLTSSGTGGMEAAVVNTLSPGDRVLAVSIGLFGDRFAEIAQAYGAEVVRLSFPLGQAADPEQVAAKIAQDGPFAAVLLTQNETSAGVTNDVEELCAVIHRASDPAPLILADGISGIGAIRFQTDAWGCDVVVSGSQKAWMAPPGIAMISFGPRAWDAYRGARMPRFYFDLAMARQYARRGQTPATPNLAALYGLHASLKMMIDEGLEAIVARHQRIGDYCREGIRALGLELFADPDHYSNTVTAVTLGQGASAARLVEELRSRYDIHVGGGKVPGLEMIRIGHMGYVSEEDLDQLFSALADVARS